MGTPAFYLAGILIVLGIISVGCDYAAGNAGAPSASPTRDYDRWEVMKVDVASCEPQSVTARASLGTETIVVNGADGDICVLDLVSGSEQNPTRFACRIPRSLGTVSVYEFDQEKSGVYGYPIAVQYSFDLGSLCTLAECGPGTVFPADCPRP